MTVTSWKEAWEKLEQENQKLNEQMWHYKARLAAAETFIEDLLHDTDEAYVRKACQTFLETRKP